MIRKLDKPLQFKEVQELFSDHVTTNKGSNFGIFCSGCYEPKLIFFIPKDYLFSIDTKTSKVISPMQPKIYSRQSSKLLNFFGGEVSEVGLSAVRGNYRFEINNNLSYFHVHDNGKYLFIKNRWGDGEEGHLPLPSVPLKSDYSSFGDCVAKAEAKGAIYFRRISESEDSGTDYWVILEKNLP